MNAALAVLVLAAHAAVIAFNVLGLAAIVVGSNRNWSWVRIRWWRALHLASWAVVAAQALFGRACFLTLWQAELEGEATTRPLVMRVVNGLIYWDLPMWAFGAAYLLLFALVLMLWKAVPPHRG